METIDDLQVTLLDTKVEDEWCYKCKKFFDCTREAASRVGLAVVDGLYQPKIKLLCDKKKHEIRISYTKKLHTLSCGDCRREEREEWKEQLKLEEQQRTEQYQRKQKELFEQARIEMERNRGKEDRDGAQQWQ